MKIGVMGAGAVGCYYGGMLARAGHELVLVGRPTHVEALQQRGLRLQTAAFDVELPVRASTEAAALIDAALVLFCVKSTDTEAAGLELRDHLAPDALVLSLQNGVDNAERLQALVGVPVWPAVVYVAAEMAGPGHVKHNGRGELVIGPTGVHGTPGTLEAAGLLALLGDAGVPAETGDNVAGVLWAKLVLNCAYNALSALTNLPTARWSRAKASPASWMTWWPSAWPWLLPMAFGSRARCRRRCAASRRPCRRSSRRPRRTCAAGAAARSITSTATSCGAARPPARQRR
ncbi:2-dehydropantoate 2-reductase [Methylibium sp. T29]|nr:2-dehydropantoate 2-reductase [Methylibium sp. T29]EWS62192.1 2-dehydropantoate 2-reductase [Methylibium sp. T29-B]